MNTEASEEKTENSCCDLLVSEISCLMSCNRKSAVQAYSCSGRNSSAAVCTEVKAVSDLCAALNTYCLIRVDGFSALLTKPIFYLLLYNENDKNFAFVYNLRLCNTVGKPQVSPLYCRTAITVKSKTLRLKSPHFEGRENHGLIRNFSVFP